MAHCELCGSEVDNLTKTKVSGAELKVCSSCTSMGQTLEKEESDNTDTKYSTDSSSSTSNSTNQKSSTNSGRSNSQSNSNSSKQSNPFDEVSNLAMNYGDIIQSKRSQSGTSREDLAQDLGIKESHLRNIENQETQPSMDLQQKIERKLDIDLSQSEDLGQ